MSVLLVSEVPEVTDSDWREYVRKELGDHAKTGAKFDIESSARFPLLCEILKLSQAKGDKVLVFSQFLTSLNLIEEMFRLLDTAQRHSWTVRNIVKYQKYSNSFCEER